MKRLYIVCEGHTEEAFVKEVLAPAYTALDIRASRVGKRGGIKSWGEIENDVIRFLKDQEASVSMMIDFYRLPKDTPGISAIAENPKKPTIAAQIIQEQIACKISCTRFIPFLMVHEFEALLFSNPDAVGLLFSKKELAEDMSAIKSQHQNPECINGGKDTKPACRIEGLFQAHLARGYAKPLDGPNIAKCIGLERLAAECPHFKGWLDRLRGI